MSIKEQKRKVLKMLEDDIITQEQALDLLEMIAREGEIDETRDQKVESVNMAMPREPFDFFGSGHQSFALSQEIKTGPVLGISLKGKNSKVAVFSHSRNEIVIKGWVKSSRNNNPMLRLEEMDGHYYLDYNYHGVRYIGFDVYIPEKMHGTLLIENSNATIEVRNVEAQEIIATTKNASIDFNSCYAKRILATTKNSYISARKIKSEFIELYTTNDKINVREVYSKEGDFKTSNATIDIQDSYIENNHLETKNAQIWLEFSEVALKNLGKAQIEARTTNANIECVLPEYAKIPYKISGTTKRGNVETESGDLLTIAQDRGYLVAQTKDFEKEKNSFLFNLQTTNGNIRIRDL